ncbi:hypothetical protein [Parasphingorhabdus sp.]|uniref:hypothetical protein n=1 Tax=Parasphingorhabdus sp. TaxID=2709688 RepID=UPI0032668484
MPPIASNIILYTSIAAFVLCVIGGLLILFERWEPKHSGTRRWLVGGVLASIVGGVVANSNAMFRQSGDNSTAVSIFNAQTPESPNGSIAVQTERTVPDPRTTNPEIGSTNDIGLTTPSEPDVPNPTPPATSAKKWSERIVSWQSANLPARPTLPDPPDKSYPECADKIKAQDFLAVTKQDARDCFRLLDQFNSKTLLPYQFLYHPYTDEVEKAARYQPDAEILTFLQSEYLSLTDSEGADFLRFNQISNKFDGDRRWMQRLK